MSQSSQSIPRKSMRVVRVLLAENNTTARLTLQGVLEAGGYNVDAAATVAEAMAKLELGEYSLVLTGRGLESADAATRLVAHAKQMDYRPATAYFEAQTDEDPAGPQVVVAPEDIPELLGQVAELISRRASRQVHEMRMAG
jgi:CheY-like chemotaxis protein